MTCMTHCKSVALTSRPWKGKSSLHIAAFLHASTIQTNGNKHTRTLGWHFQKLQHISNFSTIPNHSYDSTFNGACQPSLRLWKRYIFCFLCFISTFWHISRNGKNSPLFTSLIQTKSIELFHIYSQSWHLTLNPHTNNQYYHHSQTPPFKASLSNQCWCLSDGGLDDKRPSHRMCHLGTNWWSHWLRGLLFWEWMCIMHTPQLPPQSTIVHPLRAVPKWTMTQVLIARCLRPSTRHLCHHVLGLPPNSWASHWTESAFRNLIIQDLNAGMVQANVGHQVMLLTSS